MRHRTLSRKTVKTRGRKATKATPSGASISARSGRSSVVDLQEKLDRQTRELNEAHEQQAATSEVLEIIGHSTFDLQRVLESLLEKAVRLCSANRGFIFTQDGDSYRLAANFGHSAEFVEKIVKRYPITQRLGVTEQDVVDMNRRLGGDASLNDPIREESDSTEWQDWLVSDSPDQEETLAASEEFDDRRNALSVALGALNPRARRIFEGRRLAEDPMTLAELADEFGVSRERVRQIEVRAFEKVQKIMNRVATIETPAQKPMH